MLIKLIKLNKNVKNKNKMYYKQYIYKNKKTKAFFKKIKIKRQNIRFFYTNNSSPFFYKKKI